MQKYIKYEKLNDNDRVEIDNYYYCQDEDGKTLVTAQGNQTVSEFKKSLDKEFAEFGNGEAKPVIAIYDTLIVEVDEPRNVIVNPFIMFNPENGEFRVKYTVNDESYTYYIKNQRLAIKKYKELLLEGAEWVRKNIPF